MQSDIDRLRKLYDGLRELKTQHSIGSQSAHHYLKEMARLEKNRDLIMQSPELESSLTLTIRELAGLMTATRIITSEYMELLWTLASTPQLPTLKCSHLIIDSMTEQWLITDDSSYDDDQSYDWKFDFVGFLQKVLTRKKIEPISAPCTAQDIFNCLQSESSDESGNQFLTCHHTGEKLSLREFATRIDLRRLNTEYFWNWVVENYLCEDEPDVDDFRDDEKLDDVTRASLASAYGERDINACHEIIAPLEIRLMTRIVQTWIVGEQMSLDNGTIQLENLLYPIDYVRAMREQTLHRLDTQRNVALSAVFQFDGKTREMSHDTILDATLEEARRSLESWIKLFERYASHHAPTEILRRASIQIDQANYVIKALTKNRHWLIEFLSQ